MSANNNAQDKKITTIEDVVYGILECSETPMTAREIYEAGAKEFYSMDQLSRLLYDLKKESMLLANKTPSNQNMYSLVKNIKSDSQAVDVITEIQREGQSLACKCNNPDLANMLLAGLPFLEHKMPRYAAVIKQAANLINAS